MIEAGTVEQSSRQAEAEQQNREATGQTGWGFGEYSGGVLAGIGKKRTTV
jgi:hypothetical protein